MNSEISIAEIRLSDQGQFIFPEDQHGVDLGGRYDLRAALAEQLLNPLMQVLKGRAEHLYLLFWQGDKVPRGAIIEGQEIAWTQNGMVTSSEGKTIGYYDRIVEYGGESRRDQQMLMYTLKPRNPRPGNEFTGK